MVRIFLKIVFVVSSIAFTFRKLFPNPSVSNTWCTHEKLNLTTANVKIDQKYTNILEWDQEGFPDS
jgi:hypothetical protein